MKIRMLAEWIRHLGLFLLFLLPILSACTQDGQPADSEKETASEFCTDPQSGEQMSYEQVLEIAQDSECVAEGPLKETHFCNDNTGTWWIDLAVDRPGCNPACVVYVAGDTLSGSAKAEINWRCTGALSPVDTVEPTASAEPPRSTPTPEESYPAVPTLVPPVEGESYPPNGFDDRPTPASVEKLDAYPADPTLSDQEVQDKGELKTVDFQDISFSYPSNLASGVIAEIVDAAEYLPVDGAIVPQHEQFLFDDYILQDTFHQPRIYVYPAGDFSDGNEFAAAAIVEMTQLLEEQPQRPESIPFLPLFNARPLMISNIDYLDFQNGQGVRFLSQYAQAFIPINNQEIFYTFQGLTGDGRFYVSAILPISHPALPPDGTPPDDYNAFADNFESYRLEVEELLNAQEPVSFVPDLEILDTLIQSILVNE